MNENCKLVSVVVQAYNSADTIERTLDSVKVQTYPNIELIITDDKSIDNTVDICLEWIKNNKGTLSDMQIITSSVNTGISGSNNRALKQAKGKYVGYIAADDYMTPDAIAEYVKYCEENPNIVPISRVELFSDEECDLSAVQNYCSKCYEFAVLNKEEQLRQLLIQNRVVAPAAAFYPIEILETCNGFDEAYRMMEDYPINLKILVRGYKFGFLDKKLIFYRISNGSITRTSMSQVRKTEAKLFFREKMWYMFKNKMGWEAIKQSRYWVKFLLKKEKY